MASGPRGGAIAPVGGRGRCPLLRRKSAMAVREATRSGGSGLDGVSTRCVNARKSRARAKTSGCTASGATRHRSHPSTNKVTVSGWLTAPSPLTAAPPLALPSTCSCPSCSSSSGTLCSTSSSRQMRRSEAADTEDSSLTYRQASPRTSSSKATRQPPPRKGSGSLLHTDDMWILTRSPLDRRSEVLPLGTHPTSGYSPMQTTPRATDISEHLDAQLGSKPNVPRQSTSCRRDPASIFMVPSCKHMAEHNPDLDRAASHASTAMTPAKWSDVPPACSEKPRRVASALALASGVVPRAKGARYDVTAATDSRGSNTPRVDASRRSLPARGWRGSEAS
mmetsp:Transcript_62432/g.147972  ORF Transcript_62432/g.147972 Transcript_62432/m.147972 type:complete len:336 (+) Transcript_62432:281-1288(+)